jgi:Na+/phosphate symporter
MRKNGIEISPALEKIIIKEVEIAVANKEKEVVKMIEEEIIDISDGVIEAEEPTLADEINRWNAKIEDLASRIRSIKQK